MMCAARAAPETAHLIGFCYEECVMRLAMGDQFLPMTELETFLMFVDQVRGSHLNPKP